MEFLIQGAKYGLLIDTGASLSVLKYDTVARWNIPVQTEYLYINGIGGKVLTSGYVYVTMIANGQEFEHKFYIMRTIPGLQHGIIGRDFMSKYNAILNYENNTITLKTNDNNMTVTPDSQPYSVLNTS